MSNVKFETVVSIEELPPEDDWVYDIEMEDRQKPFFFANDILVHNSVYFKIPNVDNIEDAVAAADGMAGLVNDSFQPFMQETFLCQPVFDNLIKAAREIVSDSGIFVEKKRYILHLVDKDGERCDKVKVMGLDTKKTTIPRDVSEKLNKFIVDLLLGKDWNEVSKEIVEYKKQLLAVEDIRTIGLPKGVKKIEQYREALADDPGTRVPGHVMASLYYNKLRAENNDLESLEIMSGMKIKIFWLQNQIGRFKSVALPVDQDILPDWFLREVNVDRQAQITRLVDKPLSNILKAIGKTPPSEYSLLMDECWEF